MSERDLKRQMVDRILSLPHLLPPDQAEIDRLLESGGQADHLSSEAWEAHRSAHALVRFLDDLPGGFLACRAGPGGELICANRTLLDILQCASMEELRAFAGNSFPGMVHPEDLATVEEVFQRQLAQSHGQIGFAAYRVRRRDGSLRWVESHGRVVPGGRGGPLLCLFLADAAVKRERQLAEHQRRLAEAQERAEAAVSAKNTFLANVSHDMRTPLNAILGFTSLAKMNLQDPDTARAYLGKVEASSRVLLDMIDEVLQVSALANAAGPAEVECDVGEALREVFAFLEPQAQEKGIRFTLDCGGVRRSRVYANCESFKQLVLNLTNNALTYTDAGGRVSVVLTEEDLPGWESIYHLVVEDTGVGISEAFLERIFEPFVREKNTTLSGIHGIGLGLTIAKGIVEKMGGRIDVKSVPGKGSTFTVTFRFRTLAGRSGGDGGAALRPSRRLLLVEDNEINREIETELLEKMGFVIDPAENGLEALEKMKQAAPGDYDLIIMDLQMPVMDGWQSAAAIRALPDTILARIPIVALSANVLADDQRKSRESGIDAHLTKPMDLPVLLDTIEALTGYRLGDCGR